MLKLNTNKGATKLNKKLILPIIASSLFFAACSESSANTNVEVANTASEDVEEILFFFDYPSFENIEELSITSDLVVKGKVLSSYEEIIDTYMEPEGDSEEENPGGEPGETIFPYQVVDFEITEVYHGDAMVGDVLPIKQFGGEMDGVTYSTEDVVYLEDNSEYVVFLNVFDDSPAVLTNYTQSLYEEDGEEVVPVMDAEDNIELEIAELEDLETLIEEYTE